MFIHNVLFYLYNEGSKTTTGTSTPVVPMYT